MIKIKIPATSANIGPGFDCLGIALNLYNIFYIDEIESGFILENCFDEFNNENNLMLTTIIKFFNKVGYKYKGIKIIYDTNIPIGVGLGSSSTCILAGVIAANEISNANLSLDKLLNFAVEIEGHSDNITPALYGGLTVSTFKDNVYYKKFNIDYPIKFYSIIPNFTLSTKASRALLPTSVSFKDTSFNISATSLVLASLVTGDLNLLKHSSDDKIHEDYRIPLIPDYNKIKNEAFTLGAVSVYLSGSGPTIMCIVDIDNRDFHKKMTNFINKLTNIWAIKELYVCNKGTEINIY